MSIVSTQHEFLVHAAKLILKADELGFGVTGGELYRTEDQQRLHVAAGRSKTMNSQHLKRLAIDLNFFKGGRLTYSEVDLEPLGVFWESLHPSNSWGGHWKTFKDTPHFERRE